MTENKRKAGKPRRKEELSNKVVRVRMTEEELQALENMARYSGGTISSVLREVIERQVNISKSIGSADVWKKE